MSSHHFVKENQEPALLILDTTGMSFETVAPLLEWVPTVLVGKEEVWTVISWGIKIDVILADLAFQVSNVRLLEEQYPVKFMGVETENTLEDGLAYLVATKHTAVNVIGLAPWEWGRLSSFGDLLDIVLWKKLVRYFFVREKRFKKWVPFGRILIYCPKPTTVGIQSARELSTILIEGETTVPLEEGFVEIEASDVIWIGEEMSE